MMEHVPEKHHVLLVYIKIMEIVNLVHHTVVSVIVPILAINVLLDLKYKIYLMEDN